MSHRVSCQHDGLNYNFTVIVDDRIATTFPYTSWFNPKGVSETKAQAAAENLTLALEDVVSSAPTFDVEVDNNGTGYDVLVNGKIVYTYGYSGIWVVGGLIKSKTTAMAHAFELAHNLLSILGGHMKEKLD